MENENKKEDMKLGKESEENRSISENSKVINENILEEKSEDLSKENDKKVEKNPFEGQVEIKCNYRLKYRDLFEGFDVMNDKKGKGELLKKIGFFVITVSGAMILSTGNALIGIIVFMLGFYFVLRDVIAPLVYRHKVSKLIASRKEVYTARFYPQGVRITEKNKNTDIMFSDIKWKEYKNVNVLLYKSKIAIIPKRYLKNDIDNIMVLAKRHIIEYVKVK